MKSVLLSRFTPSLMKPDTLEAIFVQRETLAERLVELIRDSALTSSKHHALLIGPRGIGKTHVIALVYHRIRAMEDLRAPLLIAWCREEEWGVTSFLDLLLRILRALVEQYNDHELKQRVESLYELEPDAAERKAAALLKEHVNERVLLLLAENLSDVFDGLGDEGQKRLRSYLQENPFITILATAQRLFNGVSLQTSPFYGFFRVYHLEELELDDATLLLTRIAECEGDKDLASFIQNPTGRARIRAVHHLAGGNHRVYVIFSQLLTRDSLDELAEMVVQALDDLTPYYQSRIAWLSRQQRKIVELLCDRRHAVNVKEIAQRCFMTHQTAASQLKDLREKGYVCSEQIGRESYHELREPLMRLCLEVKKQRGDPIRLIVDFLRCWYSPKELLNRLESLPAHASLEREYILHALQSTEKETEDPRIHACVEDFFQCVENRDFASGLNIAEELLAIYRDEQGWFLRAWCLAELGKSDEALVSLDKAIHLGPDSPLIWSGKGQLLAYIGRQGDALKCFDKATELDPDDALARVEKGRVLIELDRNDEAITCLEKAIELDQNDCVAWGLLGRVLSEVQQHEESLVSFDRAIQIDPSDKSAWSNRAIELGMLGRNEEALASFQKTIQLDPNDPGDWYNLGLTLMKLGRPDEALSSVDKAIELGAEPWFVFFYRGNCLLALDRWEEACAMFDEALHRSDDADRPDTDQTSRVIACLLGRTHDTVTWPSRLAKLIHIYKKHESLGALGRALVESIPWIMSPKWPNTRVQKWYNTWQGLAGECPEFKIPLRLLGVAVRYREKKDRRILLELPIEERKILEELLETKEASETKGEPKAGS